MADLCLDEYNRPQPLWPAHRHRRGRQRLDHRAPRVGGRGPGEAGADVCAVRDDGRPGARHPATPSTRRAHEAVSILAYAVSTPPPSTARSRRSTSPSPTAATAKATSRTATQRHGGPGRSGPTLAEGADMVMVKPALAYLDLIARAGPRSTPSPPTTCPAVLDDQGRRRQRLDRRRRRRPRAPDRHQAGRRRPHPPLPARGVARRPSADSQAWPPPDRASPSTTTSRTPACSDAPAGDPGRRELASACLPLGGRLALLRMAGPRPYVGRRGQTLPTSSRAAAPSSPPRPPVIVEAVRGPPARASSTGADRARGAAGRGDLRAGAVVRDGAPGQQRHRRRP